MPVVLRWLAPIALLVTLVAHAEAGAFKPRGAAGQKKGAAAVQPVVAKATPARATVPRAPAKSSRVATKARPDDLTPAPAKRPAKAKKKEKDEDDVIVVDDE
jgi:hypothetical protein